MRPVKPFSLSSILTVAVIAMTFASAAPAADSPGLAAYLDGLDALEQARWTDAAGSFSKAIGAEEENADYYTARGVAYALAEKLAPALSDLQRADRLRPNFKPTRLWLATVVGMQGRFTEDVNFYPAATRDPYESAVRAMSRKYGELAFRAANMPGESDPKWQAERNEALSQFATLARQFVQRAKPAGAPVGGALKQRGLDRYRQNQFAQALTDLQFARQSSPDDPDVIFAIAGCKLALGSPEGARADYTIVLTGNTQFALAYLGRALAQADLGGVEAARRDFASAQEIDAQAAAGYKATLDARLAAAPQPVPPEARTALLAQLFQSANKGAGVNDLQAQAMVLVKAVEGSRLRADEHYQLQLAELRKAAAAAPSNAAPLANLGEFLYNGATMILAEAVEPRAAPKPYRHMTKESQQRELAEAEQTLDKALSLDANNLEAMAFKAACLMERSQWADAETLLRRAIQVGPHDATAQEFFARVMDHAGGEAAATAANLRSVKSWSDALYHYTRSPTQAELREADRLDAKAKQCWAEAKAALEAAAEAERGTARGAFYQALLAQRNNDLPAVRAALENAVKLDPGFVRAWQQLVQIYDRLNLTNEAYQARFTAANALQTTAGPMLKLCWLDVGRTAWKSAGEALDQAATADPADPRLAAYRGVIAQQEDQAGDAAAWFAVAAAVNNAQAQLKGLRLSESGGPPLSPEAAGLTLQLNLLAGQLALDAGRPQQAAASLAASLPLYDRIAQADRYKPVTSAMLPAPQDQSALVPEAPNVETLLCWTRLRRGEALSKLGQADDAARDWQWAMDFEARKPAVLDVGSAIRQPATLAAIDMLKVVVAKGDINAARLALQRIGAPRDLPPAAQAELQQLQKQIDTAWQQGQQAQVRQAMNMSPADARRQALLNERDGLLRQKQTIQQTLNDPKASDREKQLARGSIEQLDQVINNLNRQIDQSGR